MLPLAPFFVLGAGMGMLTAWWELKLNHCVGPEFDFTWPERILIAGRAMWFHLGTLFWPAHLVFIYPRWQIDSGAWWQYLFPLGAVALLAVTWAMRHATRAPLAAVLFFGGTLFPTLGFFNLYTFRYSLIADHYQYLASLGIITLFSAGVALLLKCAEGWVRVLGQVACVALVAVLAVLSWRQSRLYADFETLFGTTAESNPECWMVQIQLGRALVRSGKVDEGIAHLRKALEITPGADTHYDLGLALARGGHFDEAIAHFRKALDIQPDYVDAHDNLGIVLARCGQVDEAITHFRQALEIKPNYALAHYNLGTALAGRRQFDEAIIHFRKALEIQPDYVDAHINLGIVLADRGQVEEALDHYQQALALALARNDRAKADALRASIRLLLQRAASSGDRP